MANPIVKLSQLAPDQVNLNTGTEAGAQLLDKSLDEVGYARSLVMSADGVILCGNQTHKASLRRGDGEVQPIIVETDAMCRSSSNARMYAAARPWRSRSPPTTTWPTSAACPGAQTPGR